MNEVFRRILADMTPELRDRIRKDEALSRVLKAEDRSFVYSKVDAYRVFP